MIFEKPYYKWSTEEKKKFAEEAIASAKKLGIPLRKKNIKGMKSWISNFEYGFLMIIHKSISILRQNWL